MNIAERLWGRSQTTALQKLDRKRFSSDEEYLLAAAKLDMEHRSPEFQAAYNRVSHEFKRQQEAERRKQEDAEWDRLMKTTKLDEERQKHAMERASEAVARDLAARRIFAKDVAKKTDEYRKQFEEEELRSKVAGIMMNNSFRQSFTSLDEE